MEKRELGNTDLLVTPLGFGTAQIGFLDVPQSDCDRILNGVLDAGINVIDTAACDDASEAKIGQTNIFRLSCWRRGFRTTRLIFIR